jgi:endonuclease III
MMDNGRADAIDRLLGRFSLYAEDLGIDLSSPEGRFKWFVAAILFGARIGERIAMATFRRFDDAGALESPDALRATGWDGLVALLDLGGYARYDFSTADKLLAIMEGLKREYGDDLEELYKRSPDEADLEKRLREFRGIGPTTTRIFLRELRDIWRIRIEPGEDAQAAAGKLGIDLGALEGAALGRAETALVKLHLRYCKKRKCAACPVADLCDRSPNDHMT